MGKCAVMPIEAEREIKEWIQFEVYNDNQTMRNEAILPLFRVNGKRYASGVMMHLNSNYSKVKATYCGDNSTDVLSVMYIYTQDANGAYATAAIKANGVEGALSHKMRSGTFCLLRVSG